MTRGYIGDTVVSSEYATGGVLSLRDHFELASNDQLPEKLPNPPATSNVNVKFPTDECELLTTFTTVSGHDAKYFDPNGLYMFTASGTIIYRYDFTVPHELKSLNTTAAQSITLGFDGSIGGIFFKPDGTKLFVTGGGGDDIKEYNLSTAWDVDTLTYTGRSLDLNLTSSMKEGDPRSLAFSPDGTKIVITGSKGIVFQLDLGTAWDITTATTYCEELNIQVSSGGLFGHSFSANGDSIFIADNTNDNIHKYDLTTPWDITTTQLNQFYTRVMGETAPAGGTFNSDGTKFYFTGSATDQVYELELADPYNLNTATFNANLQRYYLARDNTARTIYSFFFKPDGTKLFALDNLDRITEYSLTTAWDPATIRFLNSFSVTAQETEARDLFFKPDGTKMFVIGSTGDDVNEYELSTAWDTTTAVFSQNFSINAQETVPTSIAFSNDGTKMFVMGTTGDDVNEYALSEAWDVSTASYTRVFSLTVSGLTTNVPQALLFKPDGTAFYIINAAVTSNYITKYSLGTAWDLSTAAYDSSEFFATPFDVTTDARMRFNADGTQLLFNYDNGIAEEVILSIPLGTAYNINTAQINQAGTFGNEGAPTGIHWGDSGNYLYVVGSSGDAVDQYEALIPYKVSTCRFLRTYSVSGRETAPQSVYFKPDGTKMFVIGSTGDDVNEYALSTAWDISSASYTTIFSVAGQTTVPSGFAFNGDGTKMFVIGQNNNTVFEYSLGTGWDISTASYSNNSLLISFFDTTATGLALSADGTTMFVIGQNVDCVNQIDLASAYTLTPKNIFYVGDKETSPYSATFKPDGTKMYIIGITSDTVHEYDLSTDWDISTATFLQSFSVNAQETIPGEIRFKPDGTKMFIMGTTGDDVNEYALSTAWDISSASFTTNFSVNAQETAPGGLFFKSDGTKFYVLGIANDTIHQYSLSTAWDMSTASYDDVSFSIAVETTNPYGLTFKSDGTRLYFIDNTSKRVMSFDLDTAWDLSSINIGRFASNFGSPYYFDFSLDGNTAYISSTITSGDSHIEFHSLSSTFDIKGSQYVDSRNIAARNDNVALMSNGKLLFSHNRTDSTVYIYTAPNKGGQEFGTANVLSYSSAVTDLSAGSLSLAQAGTPITGFVFDSTGTKLYTVDADQVEVNYFVLSVAWDITTATFNSVLPLKPYDVRTPNGIRVTPDGKYLLVFSATQFQIVKFEMTTPFDLSTSVYVKRSKRIAIQKNGAGTFEINNSYFSYDGRILYISSNNDFDSIFQFYLDENHEVINDNLRINFEDKAIRGSSTMYYINSFCFSKDGDYLYGASPTLDSGTIFQYKLSSPFIVDENISAVSRFTISSEETAVRGVTFNDDGTKMYIVGQTNDTIYEYDLTTAWDLSSASYSTNSFAVSGVTTTPASIRFKSDGTKMFLLGETDNTVYQYSLSSPWSITSGTYDTVSLDISSKLYYIENSALGGSIDMEFNETGTQLNIAVRAEETLDATVFFRYNLSTPWDLSTATYLDNTRYMERHDTYGTSFDQYSYLRFADQGRILYLNNNVGDSMIGYRLRTPYDIKSMLNPSLGFINDEMIYDATCYSGISEDGKLLLIYSPRISGIYPFRLVAYRLTTPFDISTATKTYNTIVSLATTGYCNFLDFSGQHLFYAGGRVIYKIDLSSINP